MRSLNLKVAYEDGLYIASGREETDSMIYSVIAQGETWEKLKADVQDVLNAVYYDTTKPHTITLDLVLHEELLVA